MEWVGRGILGENNRGREEYHMLLRQRKGLRKGGEWVGRNQLQVFLYLSKDFYKDSLFNIYLHERMNIN